MILDGAPIPPYPPGCEPPGPIYSVLTLLVGLALLVECLTFLLPEPWHYELFRAVFERVWPFSVVDRWIRSQLKGGGE